MCDITKILNTIALINLTGRYTYFDLNTNSRGLNFVGNELKKSSKNINRHFGNSNKTRSEIRSLDARHF